jgi:hypothetical protein
MKMEYFEVYDIEILKKYFQILFILYMKVCILYQNFKNKFKKLYCVSSNVHKSMAIMNWWCGFRHK